MLVSGPGLATALDRTLNMTGPGCDWSTNQTCVGLAFIGQQIATNIEHQWGFGLAWYAKIKPIAFLKEEILIYSLHTPSLSFYNHQSF